MIQPIKPQVKPQAKPAAGSPDASLLSSLLNEGVVDLNNVNWEDFRVDENNIYELLISCINDMLNEDMPCPGQSRALGLGDVWDRSGLSKIENDAYTAYGEDDTDDSLFRKNRIFFGFTREEDGSNRTWRSYIIEYIAQRYADMGWDVEIRRGDRSYNKAMTQAIWDVVDEITDGCLSVTPDIGRLTRECADAVVNDSWLDGDEIVFSVPTDGDEIPVEDDAEVLEREWNRRKAEGHEPVFDFSDLERLIKEWF